MGAQIEATRDCKKFNQKIFQCGIQVYSQYLWTCVQPATPKNPPPTRPMRAIQKTPNLTGRQQQNLRERTYAIFQSRDEVVKKERLGREMDSFKRN